MFCGDRWAEFAGNGLGYNQWVPLSFVGEVPYFNSLHAWNLDEQTGNWTVATTNNYVKNGSFESDRRHIPSNNKPVQEQLLGWHTQIIKGNTISTTNSSSPVLNYFNTREDRKKVVGEKSLNISDDIPFERRIIQDIVSTVFVVLPDGNYTLSAKIKNTPGFKQLLFYANSGGQTFEIALDAEHPEWIPVTLESVKVRHGKVTIGIYAKGQAGASAQIDDIRLEM